MGNEVKGVCMNKEDLIKTARLARLGLSEEEMSAFTGQLEVVFKYFDHISSVNTQGVEPLVHPLDGIESTGPLRKDQVQDVQNKKELLELAPQCLGNEYKVPPVVE
jgi:aspartyl-tRNA(Asn)/glutamyl-tRNA(Gln) amidotransferase subunit C